jgi:hypothetical protein
MSRLRIACALLASALSAALPLRAQEQRASIEGTVTDSSGAALPGATVEARSEAGGSASAVTDGTGAFRLQALPPGRYEVSASLSGFTASVVNVGLSLGQHARVEMSLKVGTVSETIQVTAEVPLVDTKQSARFQNLREEFVDKVPKGRDFTSLATQVPGANMEMKAGGLSVDGASASESKYVIDGIETNSLDNGLSGKELVTDFVEEVQVKSSGYAAEYSGALGGVVNAITKSGTNDWKGSAWGYYSSDGLGYARGANEGDLTESPAYGDGRPSLRRVQTDVTRSEYVTYPKDDVRQVEPGFTLGGPLVKDRVWFFAGYNPSFRTIDREVTLIADGSQVAGTTKRTNHYANANLSAQLGANTRARVAYNLSRRVDDGLLSPLEGTAAPDTLYDIKTTKPNWSLSGTVDYIVSSNLSFALRGGYFYQDTYEEGRPQGPRYLFPNSSLGLPGVPVSLQRPAGFASSAPNVETRQDEFTRVDLQADASWFFDAGGQHQLKGGVQFFRLGNTVDEGETGNRVQVRFDRALAGVRGAYGHYQVRSFGPENPKLGFTTRGEVTSDNIGLFLQDSWTIGQRFTLNAGLRTERERVPSFVTGDGFPETAIEFGFEEKLAPRLGFSWDVAGNGKWKVFGSWGLFYDITRLEMPRGSFGADHWLEYYYTLDTPDWTNLASGPSCPPACPGTLIRGPVNFRMPSFEYVDTDIQPYQLQEWTGGVEHELTPTISVGLSYVHKQIDSAIEDIGALDAQGNEVFTIGNPGFGPATVAHVFPDGTQVALPKAVRDYDAVQASFNKRMSDNWALRVSYLWSRLHGNYTGLAQGDENGRTAPNVGRNYDYPLVGFNERGEANLGPLPTDRPHQFKTQLVYDFPFGLSTGLVGFVASGTPISRIATFLPPNNFPIQYLGRNSDGRTDTLSQVDLNLVQEFKLGGAKRLQVMANVLNLLDQQASVNRFSAELEANGVSVDENLFYRGIDTRALIASQGLVRDPRFLKDSQFQSPREIRLGVRLTF